MSKIVMDPNDRIVIKRSFVGYFVVLVILSVLLACNISGNLEEQVTQTPTAVADAAHEMAVRSPHPDRRSRHPAGPAGKQRAAVHWSR